MASEISICNLALGYLGANRISSFNDGTVESILCKDNYPELRDAVLEEGRWTFATSRFTLAPVAAPAEYGYANQFSIPSIIITVIEATDDVNFVNGPSTMDWRREGDFLLSNTEGMYIKAIVSVSDVSIMPPMFRNVLAARIAAELAPTLTEGNTKTNLMWGLYGDKLSSAMASDNSQGRSDRVRSRYLTTFVR